MTSPAPPAPGTLDGPASFTATYEVTTAEQVRASRYVVSRQQGMLFVYCMIPTLVVGDALLKLSRDGRWSPGGVFFVAVLLGLLIAFLFYVEPRLRIRRLRRKHPQAEAPVSLTLDESGVAFTSGLGAGRLIWPLIPRVTANQEFLFVYLTKTQSLVVPLRVLSREQLDAFWWVVGRWAPHLVRNSRTA